jgi:glutathione synthase/RimK-type ligase-like ATP-grasp enzyme
MHSVLLATCAAHPEGDEDAALLAEALADDNVDARWAVWTDPDVAWRDLTVLRATWDYPLDRDRFLAWSASVPTLYNPAPVVAWNSDKVYLHDLDVAGVPVTPTVVVPPGSAPTFPADGEFVIKPSVGAGSRGVGRFQQADDAARAHAAALHEAGRTVLVQPCLGGIDAAGETALIYLDGRFSHAVTKAAMSAPAQAHPLVSDAGLYVQETITAREPSAAERAAGDRAMAALHERFGRVLLYARIDVAPGPSGPIVLEVELIEPSLYLAYDECAAQRFAAAIARRT